MFDLARRADVLSNDNDVDFDDDLANIVPAVLTPAMLGMPLKGSASDDAALSERDGNPVPADLARARSEAGVSGGRRW